MKTKIFIFIVSVIVLFTSGCQKEEKSSSANKNAHINIDLLMKNFGSKLKSHLKDEEKLSIDSTIWYLESYLNSNYARSCDSILKLSVDSSFITIPLDQDEVTLTSVETAYTNLHDSLSSHYNNVEENVEENNKQVLVIDLQLSAQNESEIVIQMKEYFLLKPVPPVPFSWTFGMGDDWWWGYLAGRCSDGFNPWGTKDAATQLALYATNQLHNKNTWYYNIQETGTIINTDYLYYDSGIYPPEVNECIGWQDMNQWLVKLQEFGGITIPNNRRMIRFEVSFDIGNGIGIYEHIHTANFIYGIEHVGIPDPVLQDL